MSDGQELGKIATKKVPADQAKPGNPEHAAMIAQALGGAMGGGGAPGERAKPPHWGLTVPTSMKSFTIFGVAVVILFFGVFGGWATTAPISGAAVAPGTVVASGQNFRVQHFEGGIIREIMVREGDVVEPGQPILSLDPTQAQATRDMVTNQLLAYTARVQRLRAERDNVDMGVTPEIVEKFRAAGMEDDLEEQRREFLKRVARYDSEAKIYDQQVAALEEQISGLEVQRISVQEQMENLTQELRAKKRLVDRKLTPRSEYLRLKRNYSELEGRLGALTSDVGRAKSSIAEALEQKSRLTAARSEQAVAELNNVRTEINSLRERRRAAEEVLSRVTVRAPAAGTVVSLNKNTPGAVVRAGEDIAVILPAGGELIVEARMSPRDGSIISVGQAAKLRFSSLNVRTTPEVDSEVTYVSADSVVDERTQEPYIVTRLKIPGEMPPQIDPSEIYAGMPVETYVVTGDRTFAEYVIRPLVDSFNQGLRER